MGEVAVVTDSTADLPTDLAVSADLRVVPLTVTFGDESLLSGVTLTADEFYARLAAGGPMPTTSQPAPAWFEEAYADCADAGHHAVVSIHISSELSGTCDVARTVGGGAQVPVEVVDSRQASGALALMALAAQSCAAQGGGVDDVAAAARRVGEQVHTLLAVDSLEHLRRGGRLSGAQSIVGSALRVKPVLAIVEGRVELAERTRTWPRALLWLAEDIERHAAGQRVDLVVAHAAAETRAAELCALLDERVEVRRRIVTTIGPVIGAHTGPGTVGVAAVPVGADG